MITFENVSKNYAEKTAVDSLNFTINKGEFFVLIGPSGCGKTTTLKMMNRLISLSDGTIYIDGKKISDYNIHELRWNIGYVLQQIALFPHMTVEENISVVPELKKWSKEKIKDRITELLRMVGLDPETYRNRKPDELSGGEQQRIGVIRALAADPEIILMDEPFSALDPISREKLQDDIHNLQKTIKKTIVFVTHDMEEALRLADRICLMKDGEIIQVGTPNEMIESPSNEFVRNFVGTSKKVDTNINLENIIQPISDDNSLSLPIVSVSTPLEQVLEKLSLNNGLCVEKNGEVIGVVNRQMIIQYISEQLKERGTAYA